LEFGQSGTSRSEPRGNYYQNNASSYGKYGILYNWIAVKYLEDNESSLIPGWHVPTTAEWNALALAVGGTSVAGTKLKSTTDWSSGAGTDDFGFSALHAGYYNGSFNNLGSNANFWTATEYNSSNAYNRNFNTGASMNSNNNNKTNAYSVRLVKDSSEGTLSVPSLYRLLYKSYRLARKNKRNTRSQLKFELDLESNLLRLAQELYSRTYELSPSVCFINEGPVKFVNL